MTLASLSAANGDSNQSGSPGHLYAPSGSTVLIDPSQQQQQQQQQSQMPQQVIAPASVSVGGQQQQPTAYLSVASASGQGQPQELLQPSPNVYATNAGSLAHHHHHPGADSNKTIVLAIPAKINFLTGAKAAQQQQAMAQTAQQQTGLVAEQQPRTEYATKQQLGKCPFACAIYCFLYDPPI